MNLKIPNRPGNKPTNWQVVFITWIRSGGFQVLSLGKVKKLAESMRGSRLGSTSYETDPGYSAPRSLTTYLCPEGHQFTMPFYIDADEIPTTWECECGQLAVLRGAKTPAAKSVKPLKSHYDMLLERRSKSDLEGLLKERVTQIRGKAS